MIRLFIEGQELDVNEGFTHQITYAVDDINNIDSKSTAFSKTIVLPGTAKNNKLLGNIFEFGNANFTDDFAPNVGYNFNAAKSANVLVEINGLIILKGAMRLMEIIIDGENIEYEIALFGELGGFVAKLGNKRLQELDFSEHDHVYNATNIKNSWDLVDTYSPLLSSFVASTKKIYCTLANIPLIQGDTITVNGSASNDGNYTVISSRVYNGYLGVETEITVKENVVTELSSPCTIDVSKMGSGYFYPLIDYGLASENKNDYHYKTLRPAFFVREYMDKIISQAGFTWESNFFNTNFFKRLIVPNNDNGFLKKDVTDFVNGNNDSTDTYTNTGGIKEFTQVFQDVGALSEFTKSGGVYTYTGSGTKIKIQSLIKYDNTQYNSSVVVYIIQQSLGVNNVIASFIPKRDQIGEYILSNIVELKTNDKLFIKITINDPKTNTTVFKVLANSTIKISKEPAGFVEYTLNNTINVNNTLPYNILQKDFFASILKMFNLMVTEDKYKENHLIIEPWVDFYDLDSSTYLDWSDKLDRSEPIRIKPMSEINARYYEFKYKSDSDYYNEKYKKKYNEGYGDRKFDNQLEFAKETSSNEVIFSATPLVGYEEQQKVVSAIFKWDGTTTDKEEKVASNIRILQAKKIDVGVNWDILDIGLPYGEQTPAPISGGSNLTSYGYAGHLDDPDAPNADLNFGATNELYFTLATGALSNNMFNAYYSSYMAEITDKDSRLLTAKFKLTEKDIFNLDFGKFIWVDGVLYRLIKVYDYSEGELSKVDLLRVIYTTY
jgi:hypothetical protein